MAPAAPNDCGKWTAVPSHSGGGTRRRRLQRYGGCFRVSGSASAASTAAGSVEADSSAAGSPATSSSPACSPTFFALGHVLVDAFVLGTSCFETLLRRRFRHLALLLHSSTMRARFV